MEQRHKDLLLTKRLEITSDLRFRDIRRHLVDNGILNGADLDDIENKETRTDEANALLDILPTKGPNAFAVFRDALKDRYPHLARVLQSCEHELPTDSRIKEPRVFIIHAGEDKESFVRPLVTNLKLKGLAEKDIFFDEITIKPGDIIRDRILATLSSQSLELAVLVVSTSFLNKPYWPKLEFETCLKNNKRIFPIWLNANDDNFKAFSVLVGNYSPTLRQMRARRVQEGDVAEELPNIAAEVIQRLSTLDSNVPEPTAIQTLLCLAHSPSQQSDSSSSEIEDSTNNQDTRTTKVGDEQWTENRLKAEKAKLELQLLGQLGEMKLQLLKKAESLHIFSKEKVEIKTEEMIDHLYQSGLHLVKVTDGSAILHLIPENLTTLESFWSDYRSGKLSIYFSDCLLTQEIRTVIGEDVMVRVITLEEQYRLWKKYFNETGMTQTVGEFQSQVKAPASQPWKRSAAANIMKDVLLRDKESRRELLHLCDSAILLLMTTLERDVRDNLNIVFEDVGKTLQRCLDQLAKDDCPILVAGETSSGKSTLLNVLLGENILPASVLSTTSVLCEIKYGTIKKAVIHLRDPDPTTKQNVLELYLNGPTDADLQKISQYIHTKGEAREASSSCNKVEIYWPLPLLEGGIFIVDSPGVGESEEMDEHVSKYLSEAYAFMYVINSANAGGVQPGRLPKLFELAKAAGPQNLQLLDPKAAIFVCNKWDQVPDSEQDEVKQGTLRKLKQHWPLLDESQLFCLSAIKAQEAGYVTDDLDKLLDGIDSLLPQSLRHKLTHQYSWIFTLMNEATKVIQAKLYNAERTKEERQAKAREVMERLINLRQFINEKIKMLEENIKEKAGDAVQHLRHHLQSDESKATITRDTLREAPSLTSISECDDVREKTTRLVLLHSLMAMRSWNTSNQYFQKMEADLIKDFKDTFNLIEEKHQREIDQALSPQAMSATSPRGLGAVIEDEDYSVLQKVIVGVTAPIWLPLGIGLTGVAAAVGVVALGLGLVGEIFALPFQMYGQIKKKADDKKFMKTYSEDKEGCIRGITDSVVQQLCKTKETGETGHLEDFVKGCLQRPIECLEKLKSTIPKIEEADKQMVKDLGKESRSQEELLKLYGPQLQECEALKDELACFKLRRLMK